MRAPKALKTSRVPGVLQLIKCGLEEFAAANGFHLAAALSYYFLLSFVPLILGALSLTGFLIHSSELQMQLINWLKGIFPASPDFIERGVRGIMAMRKEAGIVAGAVLILVGNGLFNALQRSINAVWGIGEPRPFRYERLMELGMMIGTVSLIFAAFQIATALRTAYVAHLPILGRYFANPSALWTAITVAVGIAFSFGAFLVLFKFIPNTEVRWRDAIIGALVAAGCFEGTRHLFINYITARSLYYSLIFGPLGTLIALLVWVYVSALIILLCAEFTSLFSRLANYPPGIRRAAERERKFRFQDVRLLFLFLLAYLEALLAAARDKFAFKPKGGGRR